MNQPKSLSEREVKFRGKLDPFYENERLASRVDKYVPDTLRFTKTKAILKKQGWGESEGDDEITFTKSTGSRQRGTMELKICTWQHVQREDSKKCDAGHFHPVLRVEELWLESFKITREEARKLAKWILNETAEDE